MIWLKFGALQIGVWPGRWRVRDVRAMLPAASGYRRIFRRWLLVGPFELRQFGPRPLADGRVVRR